MNGTIVTTTNGGLIWENVVSGTYSDLSSVFFTDQYIGYTVGYSGTILKTTDGGNNWEIQTSGTINLLSSVHFIDSNNGWISGQNGIILNTTDGGTNWEEQTRITRMPLYSIFFTGVNTGWAVGAFGTILKFEDGGVTFLDEEDQFTSPNAFSLYQNYPNPFNPATTIKYQIPEINFITLKVFDVLGKEITTLVSEEKPAGSYKIHFNAEGLTSGVYFYQLRAGNFIETKKMLILK